ncbi:MAG TPA: hypothetical protein VHE77_10470 [Dongiaceae bacterium]|nr:hypothetical protein [Dongiaceae bacterium]
MPLRLRQEVQALPRPPRQSLTRLFAAHGFALFLIAGAIAPAAADTAATRLADATCHALRDRVAAVPGDGPLFLRSYDAASGSGAGTEPALGGAFTYDNALAAIALTACGEVPAARRIADALWQAAGSDRSYVAGRLRNAYRPGAVDATPVPPMGWWNAAEGRWDEDPYQVGSATGNLAWAALALLTVGEATRDPRYAAGAATIARWVVAHAEDGKPPAGFTGGLYGYDDAPQRLTWKSTEHNTDLAAMFAWLARLQPNAGWDAQAATAQRFVAAEWNAAEDRFLVGTLPDGMTPNLKNSGIDSELWPLLLAKTEPAWQAGLRHVEQHYAVGAGFDFNDDRDGIWSEGTAQAALVYRALGMEAKSDRCLAWLGGEISRGGLIWATDRPRITTGLALSPQSTKDDFYYYRLPHLGATAWAALAATGWNPFTGAPVKTKP